MGHDVNFTFSDNHPLEYLPERPSENPDEQETSAAVESPKSPSHATPSKKKVNAVGVQEIQRTPYFSIYSLKDWAFTVDYKRKEIAFFHFFRDNLEPNYIQERIEKDRETEKDLND